VTPLNHNIIQSGQATQVPLLYLRPGRWPDHEPAENAECPIHPQFHRGWVGDHEPRPSLDGLLVYDEAHIVMTESSACASGACFAPSSNTGKERDAESGNDYFGARYYTSVMGRFISPDWSAKAEPVPYAKLDNPQSLNLYTYVFNNPVTGVDLDGHQGQGPPGNPGPLSFYCNAAKADGNYAACEQTWNQLEDAWNAYQQMINSKKAQQQTTSNKATGYLKGTLKVAAGVVAVGVVATNPEVGVVGALVGGIGGSASFVSGTTQILGTATNTDVSKGTSAVEDFGSPQGLIVGVASGGNQSLASVSTTAGNVAGLASKPESAAGVADKILTVTSLATGELESTYQTIRNMISPPPPPTPAPPGLPPGWDQ
jgi:RHS repeat-associated protein